MLVLAADASLPLLSVALLRDEALLGAIALEGKGSRNEKLLPAIDFLLAENAIDRRSIDLFAATRGPGSFTGVRIGLATIQGIALALGKPVIAIPTHEAIAADLIDLPEVVIADDAGRGETYVTRFREGEEIEPSRLDESFDVLAVKYANVPLVTVASHIERFNVAAGCARRAAALWRRGLGDRYADATPLYVRLAEAEVKLQQKQHE